MKKNLLRLLLAITLVCCIMIGLQRYRAPSPPESPPQRERSSVSNAQILPLIAQAEPAQTELKRPAGIAEEHWRRILLWRKITLSQNQPVEFYLQVIDQDREPVVAASLDVTLYRVDEAKLKAKDFFNLKPGQENTHESLQLASDSRGWIRFKGRTGQYVNFDLLS